MPALRKYEISHPWRSFRLDLTRASPRLWIALGEAQSKCQHIAGVPLQPEVASELHRIFLARGIQATTAIEGNTLTEKEVIERIEKKLKLPPSREYLGKEVDNILQACNRMLKDLEQDRLPRLSTSLIEQLNAQVLHNLKSDPGVVAGEIRKHSVGVGPYRGAPWEDCRYLLDRLCDWLNSADFDAPPGEEIIYGLIKSIVAHVYIAWIHPFGDGNGRTARLLEVKFLLEAGVPSAAAHLLSNHYNLTRTEYYRQLDQTSKSNGDLLPFIQYAATGFVDQLRDQITTVQDQQLRVSWINYVHEQFGAQKTSADRRQRDLVLAMSEKRGFIKPSDVKQLTPEIAVAYAGKTSKTISRDLNRLKKMGLIKAESQGYRATIETMLAFLPASRNRKVSGPEQPVRAKTGRLDLGD